MASFRLHLKNPQNETSPVILSISDRSKRLKYSPSISVTSKYWDQEKQRLKHQRKEAAMINPKLKNLVVAAQEIYRKLTAEDKPFPLSEVRNRLDNEIKGELIEEPLSLFDFAEKHIQAMPKRINPKTASFISPNTVKIHKQLLARLREYKEETGGKVEFNKIDLNFYYRFIDWVYSKADENGEPKYSLNTVGKYINTLKTWLNIATAEGLNTNMEFLKDEFKRPQERSVEIYLNNKELEKLRKLDLFKEAHLDRVRDLFLISCYCGLRYSDFSRLTRDHIVGNTIRIRSQKTGGIVETPISKPVRDIINKYGGGFPKSTSNTQFNSAIKDVGELAGIDDHIIIHRTRGGKREELRRFKFEMMKSHTGRRSFATNMYEAGVAVVDIMNITGHKSESEFFKYVRIGKGESVNRVMESIDKALL